MNGQIVCDPKHKLLGHYIRQHWRIENSQHYVLGVVFNEDASQIAMGDSRKYGLFRRFIMNILKQSQCGSPSQRNKLKRASWDDGRVYLDKEAVYELGQHIQVILTEAVEDTRSLIAKPAVPLVPEKPAS